MEEINLNKINCDNCGAELNFDPQTQMTNCNFCGSKFEIGRAVEDQMIIPDGILPFKVNKEIFERKVLEWLSDGDYTPDDILYSTLFQSFNGVYLPMWFYSGRYNGNWSASSGYDRVERYLGKDTNGKTVEKTRTVTDWRPSSGQCSGEFSILAFAGSGKGIKPGIATYAHGTGFSKGELKTFDSQYTLGFNILDFTSDENSTWDSLGKRQADLQVEIDARKRIPGDHYKDFYCDVLYDKLKPARILVPFWIAHYHYKGKEFHVYMDGTTTTRINGTRPVDESIKAQAEKWLKIANIWGICAAIWVVLGIISIFGSDNSAKWIDQHWEGGDGGFWKLRFIIIIGGWGVVYLIGIMKKKAIIKASKERRQKVLKSKIN
jgi:hypothetical protein